MTDKVQKIREWVKARLDENSSKQSLPQFYCMMEEDARFLGFLYFLDTMQEEHDEIVDKYLYGKEPELVDADDLPKEEPVSDDLEEAADNALSNVLNTHKIVNVSSCLEMFRLGAKWQKKRDYIPLSDDINEVAKQICNKVFNCEIDYKEDDVVLSDEEECVKAGIRWQMQKESIPSKDLEELINSLSKCYPEVSFAKLSRIAVRVAKWQKTNLWKPADGDDLPETDREVIVLVKYSTQRNIHDEEYPTYRVGFGHRPDPKGWEGKSVTNGKVEHYTPKTYDKGGWNIPDIKFWLDCQIPNIEEG